MRRAQDNCNDLIVVDADRDEYEPLLAELRSRGCKVTWFATGDETLRAAAGGPPTLWMINVRLADMSGLSLLRLIRCRFRRSTVLLIDNAYLADLELAARSAGATAYLCKPVSVAWLSAFQPRCRSPAIRDGPALQS